MAGDFFFFLLIVIYTSKNSYVDIVILLSLYKELTKSILVNYYCSYKLQYKCNGYQLHWQPFQSTGKVLTLEQTTQFKSHTFCIWRF